MMKIKELNYTTNLQNFAHIANDFYHNIVMSGIKEYNNIGNKEERDLRTVSSMVVASSMLPNYEMTYSRFGEITYPNQYLFIIGEQGSGKGVMIDALAPANQVHKELVNAYNDELLQWQVSNPKERGKQPQRQSLVYPSDMTDASLALAMKANEAHGGILFGSEADELINSMGSGYGSGISKTLRKSFEHEVLDKSRATENFYLEIENPKLSVLLSGTPGAPEKMFAEGGTENGLLSRFSFYNLSSDKKSYGLSVNQQSRFDFSQRFNEEALKIYYLLKERKEALIFEKTEEACEILNQAWIKEIQLPMVKLNVAWKGVTLRSKKQCWRVLMILTAYRNKDRLATAKELCPVLEDIIRARTYSLMLWQHTKAVCDQFIKERKALRPTALTLLDAMPKQFRYKDYTREAYRVGITSKCTINRWLKKLVLSKHIYHTATGYVKAEAHKYNHDIT